MSHYSKDCPSYGHKIKDPCHECLLRYGPEPKADTTYPRTYPGKKKGEYVTRYVELGGRSKGLKVHLKESVVPFVDDSPDHPEVRFWDPARLAGVLVIRPRRQLIRISEAYDDIDDDDDYYEHDWVPEDDEHVFDVALPWQVYVVRFFRARDGALTSGQLVRFYCALEDPGEKTQLYLPPFGNIEPATEFPCMGFAQFRTQRPPLSVAMKEVASMFWHQGFNGDYTGGLCATLKVATVGDVYHLLEKTDVAAVTTLRSLHWNKRKKGHYGKVIEEVFENEVEIAVDRSGKTVSSASVKRNVPLEELDD